MRLGAAAIVSLPASSQVWSLLLRCCPNAAAEREAIHREQYGRERLTPHSVMLPPPALASSKRPLGAWSCVELTKTKHVFSANRKKKAERVMSVMIVFTCPTSGRDIPVGALPEGQDLATRRDDEVSIQCQECGQQHTWKYRDGRLAFGGGTGPASAEPAGGPPCS